MKVLCFGDSNTYGYDPRSFWGDRYPSRSRWVDILAEKTGLEWINEGENGRCIPRREGELLAFRQMLRQHKPDLLILMLGTNDLLQGTTAKNTARRMEAFLAQLSPEETGVLLISPPPMVRGEWVPEGMLVESSRELAAEYRALSARLGIRFADAGDWNVPMAFDGVHFTEEGHRAFAEGIIQYLNKGE